MVFTKILSSTLFSTLIIAKEMFLEQQLNISEWFLKFVVMVAKNYAFLSQK